MRLYKPPLYNAAAIDADVPLHPAQQTLPQLRDAATRWRGACTKVFRQEGSGSADEYRRNPGGNPSKLGLVWYYTNDNLVRGRGPEGKNKMGGVCQALSAYWIGFHARGDDFWAWLIDQRGTNKFRDAVAQLIVFSQIDSCRDQRRWERKCLAEFGLRVKGETPQHFPFDMTLTPEERGNIIATAIAP